MKWLPTGLMLAALCMLTLPACSGRAHLGPDSGKRYKALFQVQADSRPRKALGNMSAMDAKLIMENHHATYGKRTTTRARTGTRRSGGSSLQPASLDLGGGGGGGGGPSIRLQAR